jgi:alkyl sulfatase BDS1-like metallo-beta-lactamase superfamily hydrolase
MGGAAAVTDRAREDFKRGEYRWVTSRSRGTREKLGELLAMLDDFPSMFDVVTPNPPLRKP